MKRRSHSRKKGRHGPDVLFVSQYYPPEVGAPQVRVSAVVAELRRRGFSVDVVTAMPNYPTGRIFDGYRRTLVARCRGDHGERVHRVWMRAAQGSGLARLVGFVSFAAMLPFAFVGVGRPGVVVVNSTPLVFAPVALAAARVWKVPAVLVVSDLWPDALTDLARSPSALTMRVLHRFEAALYRRFDGVTAVTNSIRDALIEVKHLPAAKVSYMPNGVDPSLFCPEATQRESDPVPNEHMTTIVFSGTLGYFSGLDSVLEAMGLLARDRPDIGLWLIGDGSDRARLQALALKLGLAQVVFHDSVEVSQLARMLPQFSVGLVSLRDVAATAGARPAKTFPMMASGLPILYVGHGEGAEVIRAHNAGVVVPPEDVGAIAAAITRLADDPAGRSQMGSNGRQHVQSALSWTAITDRWLADLAAQGLLPQASEPEAEGGREEFSP